MLAALLDRGRWCGGGRRARLKFSMNLLCNDLYSKQANRIKVTRYTDRDVDKKCYSKFVGPLVRWETWYPTEAESFPESSAQEYTGESSWFLNA